MRRCIYISIQSTTKKCQVCLQRKQIFLLIGNASYGEKSFCRVYSCGYVCLQSCDIQLFLSIHTCLTGSLQKNFQPAFPEIMKTK